MSLEEVDKLARGRVYYGNEGKELNLIDIVGEFNDAMNVLFKAQKLYRDFAEVEYRLAGLFFILQKENYGFTHLINGMKIDYDYHIILDDIFPTVFEKKNVQKLLLYYKKATE